MLWNGENTDHLQSSNTNNILGLCEREQRGERGNKLDKKQKQKKNTVRLEMIQVLRKKTHTMTSSSYKGHFKH